MKDEGSSQGYGIIFLPPSFSPAGAPMEGRPYSCCCRISRLLRNPADCLSHALFLLSCFLQGIVDAEAGRLLPRWKLLESLEELADDGLCRHEQKRTVRHPFAIEHRRVFARPLKRITPQIVDIRATQAL